MKINRNSLLATLALAASSALAFGQAAAPAAPAAGAAAAGRAAGGAGGGGGGGGGRGGGGGVGTAGLAVPMPPEGLVGGAIKPNALNDIEMTAIARFELSMNKLVVAQRDAKTAMTAASFSTNRADITAKAQALATADLNLANARADGFGKLKAELGQLPPDKMKSVTQTVSGVGGAGGRGGG